MSAILALHHPARARAYYGAGWWQDHTLYGLLRANAESRPQRFALRDSARRLTWRALLAWVDTLAARLHAAGLRPGDRVSVWLPNRIETIAVTLACSRNGYVCNPSLHQSYTVAEVSALLERIAAAALFAQPGYGADARNADIFAATSDRKSLRHAERLAPTAQAGDDPERSLGARGSTALPEPSADPDKIVLLAFTSGTTGEPKGVMHSDNTLLANARAMASAWRHHEDIVLFSMSPLTHAIGTIAMAQSLVSGFELVVNDLPPGRSALEWIIETGATYVMGVPTHAIDILDEAQRRGLDKLGKVSVFYMGGAAIPRETVRALLAMDITPQNVYGMTENGAHQYTLPDDPVNVIAQSCGCACAGYEVRIFDPDNADSELPVGSIGEIGGRGACLMLGYFDDQRATEQSFNSEGWFLSGDLGVMDAAGRLQVVGRKKDIIIRGGRNIHPARIEDLARAHPAVLKAAAFPVADARLGERVCIAVVLRSDRTLDGDELLRHLAARGLSKYDMPEYYVTLDALPLTPSGKVLKRALVERVASGQVQPSAVRWRDPSEA
ncbi:MAG: acyl--CoA ligase [Burkholderiales bacterium]|nr:acyl--CoA ligase [Burkholderiales bacterium]